ncbi:Bug family tripartite tricarboxylate transporter substrate binding protein [Falsirhodobacter sp. 20TX0035]|uniref:Bug family tripartite tricarboxylate transporter substrate binding protein n=1 Tax=Falsirhodobacter sp. 20TX0035 TaxID=3022019 RepID=UPI00232CA7D4|nr:tripartite tricarboxylate transporter substrate binding protein [Falsirhodobacter sp. 20TX0035]MDB6455090.1 tripartite tricarboxylate transporter substrate binding protein [Falsirhodobacter sp. 20TX0035]
MTRRTLVAAGLTLAALCPFVTVAGAQDYPVKTITLVTHSSPGAGGDIFLRDLSRFLGPALGANVVVENISGGSGATAVARVANSRPDGSVFYGTTPTFIYTTLLSEPEFGYDSLDPLVNVFFDPEVLYTAATGPFQSLEDVMTKAREGRGQWGAANPASLERQSLEMLKSVSGVNAAVVSHDGGGDMMINVLNGTLDMGVGEIQELKGQLEAGEIRLLAALTADRIPGYDDLPTVREAGYDVAVRKFRGIAAPKGLPPEVVAAWEAAIPRVLEDPEFKAIYEPDSLQPAFLDDEEYSQFIDGFAADTRSFLIETGVIQ